MKTVRGALAVASVVAFSACLNLDLRPVPPPPTPRPSITSFSPHAAFNGDRLVVHGDNFSVSGNTLVFSNGQAVPALGPDDGGSELVDGGLVFVVPAHLNDTAPLVVETAVGRSDPSADDFLPLGEGHPLVGAPIASLRFRHDPVGLLDGEENVLLASSLFDLVVTDRRDFQRLPGRPLALEANARDAGFVTVRTAAGGEFLEVDPLDGTILKSSADGGIADRFILPSLGTGSIATTLGTDGAGDWFLTEWTETNTTFVPLRAPRRLALSEVLGAASEGSLLVVVARGLGAGANQPAVYSVNASGESLKWTAASDPRCASNPNETGCQPPDGPVAIVPSAMGPSNIVLSLSSGDLQVLSAATFTPRMSPITLISYAPIDDLVAGLSMDKVLFTKSRDGALFQLDLTTEDVDWAVQLRGEPSVIALAPALSEIAVANRADNTVDTVTDTGQWTGRISLSLGMGSAPGFTGGIVAPYSYDTALYSGDLTDSPMDVLMGNIGLVVTIDASTLELLRITTLDATASLALRLAVDSRFHTLVLRTDSLTVLQPDDDAHPIVRTEQELVTGLANPIDVLVMPSGEIVIGMLGAVRVYRWKASTLELLGEWSVPAGSVLKGIARAGDELLTVTVNAGVFEARTWPLAQVKSGGVPSSSETLSSSLRGFQGVVSTADGPLVLFGQSADGPLTWRPGSAPMPSIVTNPSLSGVSPDGRFLVWVDEQSPQPLVRLVKASPEGEVGAYSSYHLPVKPAGPGFDPSGQWLYLPLPGIDQLDVVQ